MKRYVAIFATIAILLNNVFTMADVTTNQNYSGQQVINGKVYNYDTNGNIYTGWENGKYYNQFGFLAEGFVDLSDGRYYFVSGQPLKGLQKISNDYYYFNQKGQMCKGTVVAGYRFGENGIGYPLSDTYKELDKRVDEIFKTNGKDIKSIYNYCVNHISYKFTSEKDWTVMALEALKTGRGACYHRAALLDFMLKKAGYTTRVIWRKGSERQQHYWNQVKINGAWKNLDVGYKQYMVNDSYLKAKGWVFSEIKYIEYK